MNTGDKIKALRKEKKLTQRELSTLSGVSENAIKQYESNKRTPRLEQLTKICESTNTPFSYFIDSGASEWEELEKLLLAHGYTLSHGVSPDGESNCLDINGVSFIDEEIEGFKNQVFEYIDFLISKQSNQNKGK